MLINHHTCVSTQKLALVPYAAHHVPKYHEWMQDPDIQEATASEPLTLDEEYDMQRSWRQHGNKLTFIVCQPFDLKYAASAKEDPKSDDAAAHPVFVDESDVRLQAEIDAMIGDVNLFISDWADEESDQDDEGPPSAGEDTVKNVVVVGELELMIAEHAYQGRGYGKTGLVLFLNYIVRNERAILEEFHQYETRGQAPHWQFKNAADRGSRQQPPLHFDHFSVKIGSANHRSIALFESLGFRKESEVPNYFEEYELRIHGERLMALMVDGGGKEGNVARGILEQEPKVRMYHCACDSDVDVGDVGE